MNVRSGVSVRPGEKAILGALVLGLALMQMAGPEVLAFDRNQMMQGAWWRLWTGQWVHLNWVHFVLNAAAIPLLTLLFRETIGWRTWIAFLVVGAPGLGAAIWFGCPGINRYAGLSGLLHGVYVLGAVEMLYARRDRVWGAGLLLLGALKMLTEANLTEHGLTAGLIGGPVLTDAHRFGAMIGMFFALIRYACRRSTKELP